MVNIETEASVKASIEMLEDSVCSKKWVANAYFNLFWNKQSSMLSHCGEKGIYSFDSIAKCPYFESHRIINYKEEVDRYLAEDYSLILPISTEKIGIEGKNFFHNVFIKALSDKDNVLIYDFWAPKFQWQGKIWNKYKIIDGIFENIAFRQYPIAVKLKSDFLDMEVPPLNLAEIIDEYMGAEPYYGIHIYNALMDWIEGIDSSYHLDHVVFITLEEHFAIWKSVAGLEGLVLELLDEIIIKATSLRKLSMIYWYSQNDRIGWKEELLKRITDIQNLESKLLCRWKKEIEARSTI